MHQESRIDTKSPLRIVLYVNTATFSGKTGVFIAVLTWNRLSVHYTCQHGKLDFVWMGSFRSVARPARLRWRLTGWQIAV